MSLVLPAPPLGPAPLPRRGVALAGAAVLGLHALLALGLWAADGAARPPAPTREAVWLELPRPAAPPRLSPPRPTPPTPTPLRPRPAAPARAAAAPSPPAASPPQAPAPVLAQAAAEAPEAVAPSPAPAAVAPAAPAAPPTPAPPGPPEPAAAPPAPPAPAPAPERPLPPGALRYLRPPAPEYPLLARRGRESGTVMLRILVDALGRPREWRVEASSGHPRLDAAALAAAAAARFEPPERASARGVWVLAPIDFTLAGP